MRDFYLFFVLFFIVCLLPLEKISQFENGDHPLRVRLFGAQKGEEGGGRGRGGGRGVPSLEGWPLLLSKPLLYFNFFFLPIHFASSVTPPEPLTHCWEKEHDHWSQICLQDIFDFQVVWSFKMLKKVSMFVKKYHDPYQCWSVLNFRSVLIGKCLQCKGNSHCCCYLQLRPPFFPHFYDQSVKL